MYESYIASSFVDTLCQYLALYSTNNNDTEYLKIRTDEELKTTYFVLLTF